MPEKIETFKSRIQFGTIESDDVSCFNGRDIREILKKEFDANYSISGVYALLSSLNFTKIKPRPKHEKNDVATMTQWVEEVLPITFQNVRSAYPDKEIEFWFQDEMRFGEKTKTSSQWKLSCPLDSHS